MPPAWKLSLLILYIPVSIHSIYRYLSTIGNGSQGNVCLAIEHWKQLQSISVWIIWCLTAISLHWQNLNNGGIWAVVARCLQIKSLLISPFCFIKKIPFHSPKLSTHSIKSYNNSTAKRKTRKTKTPYRLYNAVNKASCRYEFYKNNCFIITWMESM